MVIVMMGVAGCGKSTVGSALATALGWDFQEGDDLHPQSNIDKMSAGIPLEDQDRWPWLDRVACWIGNENEHGRNGVIACSALKRSYRDRLRQGNAGVRFVYLRVARTELERRIRHRQHFMPASLLDSQLQTLQEPAADENALTIPDNHTMDEMLADIRHWVDLQGAHKGC